MEDQPTAAAPAPVETMDEFLERNKPPATTPEQYRRTAELMRPLRDRVA